MRSCAALTYARAHAPDTVRDERAADDLLTPVGR